MIRGIERPNDALYMEHGECGKGLMNLTPVFVNCLDATGSCGLQLEGNMKDRHMVSGQLAPLLGGLQQIPLHYKGDVTTLQYRTCF